jgi:beta-galactosidase
MNAEVTFNGHMAAMHPYGYSPMLVDLTPRLKPGRINDLKIAAQSRLWSSRWYPGGGIYRDVSLWVGEPCHVEPWDVFIVTPTVTDREAAVTANIDITNASDSVQSGDISIRILSDGRDDPIAAAKILNRRLEPGANPLSATLTVTSPRLWDDLSPALYELEITVSVPGQSPDVTRKKFGIRKIEITAEKGMLVNGRPVKLRGGCIHHDNTLLGAKAFPRAEERKIELLKEAGYNAIRTAHNPPSEALLDACDRLGMYVLDETFDCWRNGKFGLDYHLYFEDWHERDTCWTVKRDRNHPSVYCWSIGNEIPESDGSSDGDRYMLAQTELVRSLDPTRPVTVGGMFLPIKKEMIPTVPDGDDQGPGAPPDFPVPEVDAQQAAANEIMAKKLVSTVDIISLNYSFNEYTRYNEKFPGYPIQGTETQVFYAWDAWQAVRDNPSVIGDFTWTAFDNLGEAGAGRIEYDREKLMTWLCGDYPWLSCYQGDLDLDGRRRPQSYYRNVLWGLDRAIHLFVYHPSKTNVPFYGSGWHWADVKKNWTYGDEFIGKPIKLEAYADCDRVEFYVNGALKGAVVPEKFKARFVLPYEPGTVKAVAYRDGSAVAEDEIVSAGPAAAIELTPDRAAISADGMDLSYVTVRLTDSEGSTIVTSDVEISVDVQGAGVLEGLGSANPYTPENYGTGKRFLFDGCALICLRAGVSPGDIKVTVTAPDLPPATAVITAE